MDFPDGCIPLPRDADEDTRASLCRDYTAKLQAWISELPADRKDYRPRAQYDGTVRGLCRLYQEHPDSPFHEVRPNTRRTYCDSLKIIEATVGARAIRYLTTLDVRRWYKAWKEPKEPNARERVDRAHDAVSMFRTVLRFGAALRKKECGELDRELAMIRFEKGGAREQEMTYAHATTFIRQALELGAAGVIPADRGLAMAIGTAAQFELLLRQKDIIGEWDSPSLDGNWTGFFTWERIPGWRWRMKTSKSKYRAAAEFDLTRYAMLFPLLDQVPHAERRGAIVKGEHGLPVRERSYRKWFRQIARAAGIPDDVWSMDTRAGGATEAEESGAALESIQNAMTHSKAQTTLRYIRTRSKKIADVADARAAKRKADGGGDAGT